jgi:hypothetical protein
MSRVIQTKYIGPTNHKPARVRAWFLDGTEHAVLVPFDGDTSIEGGFPYDMAAQALLMKHNTFPAPWADAVRRVARVLGRAPRHPVLGGYLYIVGGRT